MKLITFALTLLYLTSLAIAQDPLPSPVEGSQAIEGRGKDRREKRKHEADIVAPDVPIDPKPLPQPDQLPDEGESLTYPPGTDIESPEAIQGRAEREQRRKDREADLQRRREEAERERAEREAEEATHPKPKPLGGWLGSIAWGLTSWFLWPISWVFTLIKWGGIVLFIITLPLLLIVLTVYAVFVAVIAVVCWRLGKWLVSWVQGRKKKQSETKNSSTRKGE